MGFWDEVEVRLRAIGVSDRALARAREVRAGGPLVRGRPRGLAKDLASDLELALENFCAKVDERPTAEATGAARPAQPNRVSFAPEDRPPTMETNMEECG